MTTSSRSTKPRAVRKQTPASPAEIDPDFPIEGGSQVHEPPGGGGSKPPGQEAPPADGGVSRQPASPTSNRRTRPPRKPAQPAQPKKAVTRGRRR